MKETLAVFLAGALCGALAAVAVCYALWNKPTGPAADTFAPGYTQADHSVVPTRIPMASPPPAPHQLPKGATEDRRIHIVVQPAQLPPPAAVDPGPDGKCHVAAPQCPVMHVDLSLIHDATGRRAVVSSPDGTVLASQTVDIPITADEGAMSNDISLVADPNSGAGVLSYTRRFHVFGRPVEAGPAVIRAADGKVNPAVAVGFRF